MISLAPSYILSAAFASLCQRDRMISSSRSILYRFLTLYGLLYAGFGVQSPYLPILLDNRHLRPETIALALAAGMAMRLMAAQAVARLADRLDAPKVDPGALHDRGGVDRTGIFAGARRMVADRGRRIALGGTGAAPAAQRHARPRCRGSRRVRRRGHSTTVGCAGAAQPPLLWAWCCPARPSDISGSS